MTLQYYLGHDEHAHPLQQLHRLHRHRADLARLRARRRGQRLRGLRGHLHRRRRRRRRRPADRPGDRAAAAQAQAGRVLHRHRPRARRHRRRRPGRAAGDHRRHRRRLPEHRLHRGRRLVVVRPGQPDRHRRSCGSGSPRPPPAAGSRSAPARPTGRCVATATVPGTGGWQTYTDVTRAGHRPSTASGPLFFVARNPVGDTGRARCSTSTGSTSSAAASPTTRRRRSPRHGDPGHRHRAGHRRLHRHGHRRRGRHPADLRLGLRRRRHGDHRRTPRHTYTTPGHLHRHPDGDRQPRRASRTPPCRSGSTRRTPSCFGARSDDFDGTALDQDRWTTVVRENQLYSVAGGTLRLPTGGR